MERVVGAVAGVVAWVGWLTVCPALGFPTLATAAMLNRVVAPREDPGFWLGWAVLLIALVSAALTYFAILDRGRVRASVASGLIYGVALWLVVGAVLMPLLGLVVPAPPPGSPPDPMRGSFMMLHLGPGAAVAGLVAWLVLGATLGATAGALRPSVAIRDWVVSWSPGRGDPRAAAAAVAIVTLLAVPALVGRTDGREPIAVTEVRVLGTGAVKALPEGAVFFSVIALPQAAGATLGPHAHVPGFAYSLAGVETLAFEGRAERVRAGQAGFMGAQEVHAHVNADGVPVAAGLAIAIVALAVAVTVIGVRSVAGGGAWLRAGLVALVAAGAIGTWNPWSNDWLFLSVRPAAARGQPMPLPSASRTFESADLGTLQPGPYVETLEEIAIPAGGAAADLGSADAAMLLVVEGRAEVGGAVGGPVRLGARRAVLLDPGAIVTVTNTGDLPLRALRFSLVPAAAAG